AQVQSKDQQKCINAMNKAGAKVSGAQAKLQGGCVKSQSAGSIGDADACIAADASDGVGKASGKTSDTDTKSCTAEAPDFAYAGATAVNTAAASERHALLFDLLGAPTAFGVVAKSADKDVAACQGKVLKAVDKLMSAQLKAFNGCKKGALATAINASALEMSCFDAIETDGTVAKAAGKASDARTKSCQDADLATAFPGECAAEMGAAFDACVESRVGCRTCLT